MTGGIGDRPLLHLSEDEVGRLLPAPLEGVALARRALIALADGTAELPPKPVVYPRENSLANAMPAYLRDGDLLGLKWIAAYPGNIQLGLPSHVGLLIMSDAGTGVPLAVMGAGTLTGARTAAVSGACIEALAPPQPGHVAITAAGVQARTHLAVLEALGRTDVSVVTRGPASSEALRRWADEHVPDVSLTLVGTPAEAVEGAAVVVTAVPIGVPGAHLDPAWLRDDVLLLPIEYATSVTSELANPAALFTDDVGQFVRYRDAGNFPGYRDPDGYDGDAIRRARPQSRVVCQNMGNGAVDLIYADHVLSAAIAEGAGTQLRR